MCVNKFKYGEIWHQIDNIGSYKSFENFQEADCWGQKIYADWGKKYKDVSQELDRIFRSKTVWHDPLCCYCGYTYQQINPVLRTGKDIIPCSAQGGSINSYGLACLLAFNLLYAPKVPDDIIVYRVVCDAFIDELICENKTGAAVLERGFMSTSLLPDIAYNNELHHKNLLKIYVPKGTAGVYINAVTDARKAECELLIMPNRFLALTAYPYADEGLKKKVFECQLINHEPK